jgi:hypothetical protein
MMTWSQTPLVVAFRTLSLMAFPLRICRTARRGAFGHFVKNHGWIAMGLGLRFRAR